MPSKNRLLIYVLGGFLFCLDQILKYLARTNPTESFLWKNFIGWEYFENPGIAFSLPIPNLAIVLLTPLIIFGLIVWVLKNHKLVLTQMTGFLLIIFGAISNFIDRIVFGITIDYLRIWTSVINLADIMIVCGVILLLISPATKTSDEGKNIV